MKLASCVLGLAVVSAACSKGGRGRDLAPPSPARPAPARPAPELRVELGECAGPDTAFVSGPRPGPPSVAPVAGVFGSMAGGGGTGEGAIGTGRYGTIGHGTGTGAGYGVGSGRGGMRERTARAPAVRSGTPTATGNLDKALIRRYIRRHLPAIRACYEKQLVVDPKLAGTVTAEFTIDPSGAVAGSRATGMSENVAACVQRIVDGIAFPKPNGGEVRISYPFTFQPAEDDGSAAPAPAADSSGTGTEPTPDDAGAQAVPAASSPLRGREAELRACLGKQPSRHGAVVVELSADAAAIRVHGLDDAGARACIVAVASHATRPAAGQPAQRCSFAFGALPVEGVPGIDITADAVLLRAQTIADTATVMRDESASPKIEPLYEALRGGERATGQVIEVSGPLVIRPAPGTRMKIVTRVLTTALLADVDPLLAAERGGVWKLLRGATLPIAPVPAGTGRSWHGGRVLGRGATSPIAEPPRTLSILVQASAVWVGTSTGDRAKIVGTRAERLASVRDVLATHDKEPAFAGRDDIEVAAEDDVPYRDVVDLIDLLAPAGFAEWSLVDAGSLSVRFSD